MSRQRGLVLGGGCACSATNVDLLIGLGLDEVFVLAPMVSFTLGEVG